MVRVGYVIRIRIRVGCVIRIRVGYVIRVGCVIRIRVGYVIRVGCVIGIRVIRVGWVIRPVALVGQVDGLQWVWSSAILLCVFVCRCQDCHQASLSQDCQVRVQGLPPVSGGHCCSDEISHAPF